MALREQLETTGNWLFRYRGSLPVIVIAPLALTALGQAEYIERNFGDTAQTLWEIACITISFLGLFVRSLIVGWVSDGTSGRNTKGQLAASLNTDGMYSVVRHPLYVANFLIVFGMVLFIQVPWFVGVFVFLFWVFYERIMFAEEEFLRRKFDGPYILWADETPAFFANLRKWRTPRRPFSFRMVLKREYSTFFGIIAGFVGIKFLANLLGEHQVTFRAAWLVLFIAGLTVYLTLRHLRKKTHILETSPERKAASIPLRR